MAWCFTGDKPLSDPIMTQFTDAHMCQPPLWVNLLTNISRLIRSRFNAQIYRSIDLERFHRSTLWVDFTCSLWTHNTHPVKMHVVFAQILIIWPQLMAAGTCTQQWSHWMNRIKYRTKKCCDICLMFIKNYGVVRKDVLHQCPGHTIIFALFCGHAGCCVTHHLAFVHSDGSESVLHQPIKKSKAILKNCQGPRPVPK